MNKYDKITYLLRKIKADNPDFVIMTATQPQRTRLHHVLPVRHVLRPGPDVIIVDYMNLIK